MVDKEFKEFVRLLKKELKKRDLNEYIGGYYESNDKKRTLMGWVTITAKELMENGKRI